MKHYLKILLIIVMINNMSYGQIKIDTAFVNESNFLESRKLINTSVPFRNQKDVSQWNYIFDVNPKQEKVAMNYSVFTACALTVLNRPQTDAEINYTVLREEMRKSIHVLGVGQKFTDVKAADKLRVKNVNATFFAALGVSDLVLSNQDPTFYEKNGNKWITLDWKNYESIAAFRDRSYDVSKMIAKRNSVESVSELVAGLPNPEIIYTLQNWTDASEAKINFGRPQIHQLSEFNFTLKPSKKYDNYVIFFAFTLPDEIGSNEFDFVKFNIGAPEELIALDLVPLHFGEEGEKTIKKGVPDVEVAGVKFGSIYNETIVYKHIEPMIDGLGLLSNEFGWQLTKKSIDMRCFRLIALVQVPKGTKSSNIKMEVQAKRKGAFLSKGDTFTYPVNATLKFDDL